jgi:hypothetical protein
LLELHREVADIRRGNLLLLQGIQGLLLRQTVLSRRQIIAELAELEETLRGQPGDQAGGTVNELAERVYRAPGMAGPELRVIKGGKIP